MFVTARPSRAGAVPAAAFAVVLSFAAHAFAQAPERVGAPASGVSLPAGAAQSTRGEDPWKLYERGPHTGGITDALVGVEVVNRSTDGAAQAARRGNGLVIRSDGFVLAPSALFSSTIIVAGKPEEAGKQSVVIVLHPGSPEERRVAARTPSFVPRDAGYCTVKMDNVHTPALKVALSTAQKSGDPVQIWAAAWDAHALHFLPATPHPTTLLPPKADSGGDKPGRAGLADAISDVPIGAAVVAENGIGLGLVCDPAVSGTYDRFTTFNVLDRATNCITALPSTEPADPTSDGEMVAVPGGPLVLPPAVYVEQPDMAGAGVACIAPFKIDKREVTNKDYLAFWLSLPESDRRRLGFQAQYYPQGWAPPYGSEPFPASVADQPVIGVPYQGAAVYALAHGKRLPTPYEWCMAAFGPLHHLDWPQNYVQDRIQTWQRAVDLHIEYLRFHPQLKQDGLFNPSPFVIPWIAASPVAKEAERWSLQTCEQVTQPLWDVWKDPMYLLPVGSRDYDVSPYGAQDMMLNAAEMVAPNPGQPTNGQARYMEVVWSVQQQSDNELWQPRDLNGKPGDIPFMPPLSRLYRRTLLGPSTQQILKLERLNEVDRMLMPIQAWYVRMIGAEETEMSGFLAHPPLPRAMTLGPQGGQGGEMPPHFRLEMGQPVPLQTTDQNISTGPQLYFVPTTGFRCAR